MKKSKRLIALAIVTAQIAAYAAVMPITSFASTVYAVDDSFESGSVGDWYLRNTVNSPELSVQTENGNSFLRLSVTKMNKDTNTNGNDENPCLTRDIDGTISMKSGVSVIEAKFRTNSNFFRKYFKINYPKTKGNAGLVDTTTYYDNGYGDINQNYYTLMHLHQGGNAYVYRRKNTQANTVRTITMPDDSTVTLNQPEFNAMTTYSTNTWYKVKFVINNETDNVSTYLYNESGNELASYTSGIKDIWYLENAKELETLDFFYRATSNTALETATADTLDIDDVKVYQVTDTANAELEGGSLQVKKTAFKIKFDSPMKKDTVTHSNIKLYNGTDFINTMGVYDEVNNIYTMTPDSTLTTGSYKIVFDTSALKAESNDYFDTVALVTDTIEFEYYRSSPPEATAVTISGSVIKGEILTFTYKYEQEDDAPKGTPEIQWQYSEDNVIWSDIKDADGTEYTVTSDMADCYIRATVVPKTDDGIAGIKAYSNVLMPEKAPTAENAAIVGNTYIGQYLTVTYDYFDANGDAQGESIIVWLSSDSKDGEYAQIAEGLTYQLTENDLGKYIKADVIPVSEKAPYEGEKCTADPVGPIQDAREATNLLTNGGFETGDKTNWIEEFKKSGSMEVTSDVKYSGDYSLYIKDRIYSTDNWHQKVSLQSGRTYIVDGYARLADDSSVEETIMEGYFGRGKVDRLYRDKEKVTVGRDWARVTLTAAATESSTGEIQIVCWPPDGTEGYDYYVDDIYCGELIISDIEFTAPESIDIPISGEKKGSFKVNGIVNQIGTDAGLYNETVTFELPDSPDGVYTEGNEIFVTSAAVAGKITVDAVCRPTYPSAQTEYRKSIEIELIANSATAPKVSDAVLSGTTEEGNTLTLTYAYYQVEGKADVSEIKWYASESYNGSYTEISGADGTSYTVDSENAGKYIYAEISAVAEGGESGNSTRSNIAAPKSAPEARDVKITGDRYIGSSLAGSYTFYDVNGDAAGASTFRWLRSDTANGT
ncbi:MAG: carbohydrate binding domain-containing protein, partial [Clostridia bacterium]|nr:carbohydrate binding domain-containing protein [Clostridia bacterium]